MHLSLSAKLGRLPLFSGILDQVPGAAFAIAPYTQLSRAQTQSIEVRETGGDTEQVFGPESQAAIDAFVNEALVTYESDFSAGVDGWKPSSSLLTAPVNTDADGAGVPPSDGWLKLVADGRLQTGFYQISLQRGITSDGGSIRITTSLFLPSGSAWIGFKVPIQAFITEIGSGVVFSSEETATEGLGDYTWVIELPKFTPSNNGFRLGTTAVNTTSIAYIKDFTVTQLTADGRIATVYNQGSEAADAVQATAADQPFIATAGVLEDGMRFDGDQVIIAAAENETVAEEITGGDKRTFIMWAKPAAGTGYLLYAAQGATPANAFHRMSIINVSGNLNLNAYGLQAVFNQGVGEDFQTGEWTKISIVVDKIADEVTFTVNDTEVIAPTLTNRAVNNIGFGARAATASYSTSAVYSDATIGFCGSWPRVLTSAELTKVYNATDPQ